MIRSLAAVTLVVMLFAVFPAARAATAPPAQDPPRPAASVAPEPPPPGSQTQLFQVAMVLATTSASADLDGDGKPDVTAAERLQGLPRSVSQAIADLGDFLPYRGYRIVDSVVIRTSRRALSTMKGPDGRVFQLEMRWYPGNLQAQESELMIRSFELLDVTPPGHPGFEPTDSSQPKKGFELRAEAPPSAPKPVIATSFGMSVGETLVVGTSRLNGGDSALIMLVTAMP